MTALDQEHDPSRPARLVAKNLLTMTEANDACCCMVGYNGCCGQCHNSCERCEGVGKLDYGSGPTCENCEGSGIGQGPVGYTQRELQLIIEAHEAITPDERRMFHDPPITSIERHCMNCGRDIAPFAIGWTEIQDAVARNQELPVHMGQARCNVCTPDDEEGQS